MMIVIVDTSVWVNHFRTSDPRLVGLLQTGQMVCHPFVIAEIACGTPPERSDTIQMLRELKSPCSGSAEELLFFIEKDKLYGQGCGMVDLSLLLSAIITPDCLLWTLDKRLNTLAERYNVAYARPHN